MIPIRLEMRNFLPYRNPDPLYFEGIHLACLTGHNGAGKSSLLDAITWALWGKARATRDDDLIHLGQNEMHVVLDFEQEGVIYRVNRQRTSGKRGQGTLSLFTLNTEGGLQTIKEPSMRETQNTINRILRLDYETFINSAYLQQGKADSFTTKRPAERKRILSDILGLEAWGAYEDRVKEQLKDIDRQIAGLDGAIHEIDEHLKQEPELKEKVERYTSEYQNADKDLQVAVASMEEVAHAEKDLQRTQRQQSDASNRLQEYQKDLTAAANEIRQREDRVLEYTHLIDKRDDIEKGYQTLKDARQANKELAELMRADSTFKERLSKLQTEIDSARTDLIAKQRSAQDQLQALEQTIRGDQSDELAKLQADIARLEALQTERDATNDTITQLREERGAIKSEFDLLEKEGKELNERIDTLENSETDTCPLCGQDLDGEHRQQVIDESKSERDFLRNKWTKNRERQGEISASLTELEATIKQWGTELAQLPRLRGQEGTLLEQIKQAQDAKDKHTKISDELQFVEQALKHDDYAHELREQYQQVQQERDSLAYDDSQHETLTSQIDAFSEYERQYIQLETAESALPSEHDMLKNARERHARFADAIRKDEKTIATYTEEIKILEEQVKEFRRREQEVNKHRTIVNNANNNRISAEQALNALSTQRDRKAKKIKQIEEAREQEALYKELRYAFGKNGVPAMIIESAIPELEASANNLLSRMTNGRMHLRLTTQTSNVDGSLRETLDIEIADELGTRAYEMYSGGESFRINFALRIALSEMLARRAGAHLQTLFIDEGFGTQDDDGRNKLVEAITSIQDEFNLILVITHIDELRDAFPVHIVVEKLAAGSGITVR